MTQQQTRRCVVLGATCIVILFVVVTYSSLGWIGRTFPGFFVMANRVVPSVSLPRWEGATELFQSEVLRVDGQSVSSAHEVYEIVRRKPPGTLFTYELRRPDGSPLSATVASRTHSWIDFALIQGGMAFNGLAFAAIGLIVLYLKPGQAAAYGLLSTSLAASVFLITAPDLYGPHWFFRLYALAETFLTPAFIHLALVFPKDRIRRYRQPVLAVLYTSFVPLGVYYEWALMQPSAFTSAHLLATALHGVAVVVILVCMGEALRTAPALVRRRIGIVALGIVTGVGVPLGLMAGSALLGGRVPVNAGVLAAFIFPLSLAYAIVQQDLFEIDLMLRRGTTYILVLAAVTSTYFLVLFLFGWLVPAQEQWAQAPATMAILNLVILLLIAPIRDRIRNAVDLVFSRKAYDAEEVLAQLSQRLATARAVDGVAVHVLSVIAHSLNPLKSAIAVYVAENRFARIAGDLFEGEIVVPADFAGRLRHGEIVARYEWEDGGGGPVPSLWHDLDADLLVPIRSGFDLIGLIILGSLASGRTYNSHDVALLQTIANQVVLAMASATAFGKLEEMNERLEQQVGERTVALESTNGELSRSLQELRRAYELLERNQASLLRADRLATLGRLVAGMAHEINTPLAAVQNSLQVVVDLADEYSESVDDRTVLPDDHRQIAAEIRSTAEAAATWARKASGYLSRTKLHAREVQPGVRESFAVKAVVEETHQLLAHRVRATACTIDYSESPAGVTLVGDQQRLGQVLVNLVSNAIDAYEDGGVVDGRIEIHATRHNGNVTLTVRDWAGGIPPEALPRIFDELFTTKDPGKGTGLGLWIARNLVEESFGGRLTVDVDTGLSSCFTATFPAHDDDILSARPPAIAVEQQGF